MTEANRGKKAEAAVRAYLKAYDERTHTFDWNRVQDAHSAGGRFTRQVFDFAWFMPGLHGGIEVKEVAHAFRLPHKNMTPESVAKLRKRELAGGRVVVLIHFSTTGLWRVLPLAPFLVREGGSWDFSGVRTFESAKAALDSLGIFL